MAVDIDSSILSSSSVQASSVPLTHIHIADGLRRSADRGATLILSKLNISDISPAATQALANIGECDRDEERTIERLALAHNRLTTLPAEFMNLTHLRYINLKHNHFTVFPHILTAMSSLEILDISHNKIAKLPPQAGQLVNLKVLCLSRNKLTSIPSYILQFNKLEVLQIENNPLEWPPNFISTVGQGIESGPGMKEWIQNLKKWVELNPKAYPDDEPTYFDLRPEKRWQYPTTKAGEAEMHSHTRSCSVDSSISFSSIPESISDAPVVKPPGESQELPPLHLGILHPYSEDSSPTKLFDSYATSPVDESESFDELSFAVLSPNYSFDAPIQHSRNASYAGQEQYSHRTEVLAKMSMPDLRTAKLDFMKEVPDLPQVTLQSSALSDAPSSRGRKGVSEPQSSSSIDFNTRIPDVGYEGVPSSSATYSMTSERNSYFRRLSTLPASGALPHSLLCLVDSARSMLFAASQVYQTLDHYTVQAADERLCSILRKVLEPAGSDMLQLIASLEGFDAWSRKMLPPPAICRAVVESCRNTAAAFNNVVRVLTLQQQVLTAYDDVRYSRLLLVEVYAATAEIACAWKNMVPEICHLKKVLHAAWSAPEAASNSAMDFPVPIPRHQPSGPNSYRATVSVSRARTVRRHAGSFSSKDVEIGKQLPSYDDGSSFASTTLGRTHILRLPRRQTTTPAPLPSTSNGSHMSISPSSVMRSTTRGTDAADLSHSRQNSRLVKQQPLPPSPSIPKQVPAILELPSNSKVQIDKEALQAIREAVDIAPMVWDMIAAFLHDVLPTGTEISGILNNAQLVTKRLADMMIALQDNDSLGDKKLLRQDAKLFLKAVVQVSNAIKTHREAVPITLRNNMIKLTNATEEFAILLHVSSFSPSTPRTFSTTINNVPAGHTSHHRDNQLQSSLSRSKSARSRLSVKIHATDHEGPRSALPSQSFKMPAANRFHNGDVS